MSSKSRKAALAAQLQAQDTEPSFLKFWTWLSGAWAVWIIYTYCQRFPFGITVLQYIDPSAIGIKGAVLARDAGVILLFAGVAAIACGVGYFALARFSAPWHSALERWVFSVGLGFGLLAYAVLAMGALQLYSARNFWILLAAGMGLVIWLFRSRGLSPQWSEALGQFQALQKEWKGWPLQKFLLFIFILLPFLMAFVPEVFYDAMVYHLGVPNWWIQQGGIQYYPALHAQFPFTRQMLNLLGLALQGEILAKLIHWFSGPLIVATYAAMTLRHSTPKTALIAALAFLSMPMVNINIWNAGIDVGMASFALLASAAWINALTDKDHARSWNILTGVFLGLTFGSKYPGFLCVFCLLIASFTWTLWKERKIWAAVRTPLLIGTVAFVVVLPWLVKSYVLTGNPVYPYLFKYFGGRDLVITQTIHWMNETKSGRSDTLLQLIQSPWTTTFAPVSSLSGPGLFPLAFLGFCLWGIYKKDLRESWYGPLALYSVLYMAIINWMTNQLRLGVPGFVTLCFVLAHAAGTLYQKRGGMFRFTLATLVLGCAFVGFDGSWGILYQCYHPMDVITGKETATQYLTYTHPGLNPYPSTAIYDYARQNLPPGSRLLIVGDEKVSTCHMPFIANGTYNQPYIVQWSEAAKTPEDIYQAFTHANVTHMTINPMEGVRLGRPYEWFKWDLDALARFCDFWEKHVRLVHREIVKEKFFPNQNDLWLVAVLPEKEASGTPPEPNVILEIIEESQFPSSLPEWIDGRLRMLDDLRKRAPQNRGILTRIAILQETRARGPQAKR